MIKATAIILEYGSDEYDDRYAIAFLTGVIKNCFQGCHSYLSQALKLLKDNG